MRWWKCGDENVGMKNAGMKMWGWKCGDENVGMKTRGWNCGDENEGMKMRGWKCGDEKAGGEKSGDEKVRGWKTGDESGGMKNPGMKCHAARFFKSSNYFWADLDAQISLPYFLIDWPHSAGETLKWDLWKVCTYTYHLLSSSRAELALSPRKIETIGIGKNKREQSSSLFSTFVPKVWQSLSYGSPRSINGFVLRDDVYSHLIWANWPRVELSKIE